MGLSFLLLLAVSLGVGAWLGRRSPRKAFGATWPWPAAMILVTGAVLAVTLLGDREPDDFRDLAAFAVVTFGASATLLAWAGAMAGAMIWARK